MSSSAADAANSKKRSRNANGNSHEPIHDSIDLLGVNTPADSSNDDKNAVASSSNSKKQKKAKGEDDYVDQEMMEEEMMMEEDAFLMGAEFHDTKDAVKNLKDTLLDKDFYNGFACFTNFFFRIFCNSQFLQDFGDDFDDDDIS